MSGPARNAPGTTGAERLLGLLGGAAARMERLMMGIAAFTIFVIMVLVVVDVAMRYAFGKPLAWSYPLVARYLMLYVFFLALGDTLRRNEHVVVAFFAWALGPRPRAAIELLAYLPAIPVFAIIMWLGIDLMGTQFVNKDEVMDNLGGPTWLSTLALPLGIGILLLRIVLRVAALALRLARPHADTAAAYGEPAHADVGERRT
jgi:TRAP-type C4-dicarboxylate transport system permease small subunit